MNLEDILKIVEDDLEKKGYYDRYPVRFFSMEYSQDIDDNILKLRGEIDKNSTSSVEIVNIGDFFDGEDGWIPIDRFIRKIKELDYSKSYIVVGFSEYIRFLNKDEFITTIIGLLEVENSDKNYKRRIYIPCFALFSQIKKKAKENYRRINSYCPFLNDNDDEENIPIIYLIDKELDNSEYENEIRNSGEWFGMWRNHSIKKNKPIICTSEILLWLYTKAYQDNVYNIKKISTYEGLIEELYGIKGAITSKLSSDEYYRELVKILKQSYKKLSKEKPENILRVITLEKVNTQEISCDNVYLLWKNSDEFERWLIQNYVLYYEQCNGYLYYLMESLENLSLEGFVEAAYICEFERKDSDLVDERRRLIKRIGDNETIKFSNKMKEYYKKNINDIVKSKTTYDLNLCDFKKEANLESYDNKKISNVIEDEIVPILTDSSEFERCLIIWLFREGTISIDKIKEIYPGLLDYLSVNDSNREENLHTSNTIKYFDIYRKSKLLKNKTLEYDKELAKWNKDEDTFYSWYMRAGMKHPEAILKSQEFKGNTYVFDGVGGEFLDYIINRLRRRNFDIDYFSYSISHLPSITSVAKDLYDMENNWVNDYDKNVVHGQIYYPVLNMQDSLEIIDKMINNVMLEEGDNKFAIIADHGATVGHKIFKKDKKYNFKEAEHDGRCYRISEDKNINSTEDYLSYTDSDTDERNSKWLISLNEQSLYNNSKYAVHGGATPEEVIIPVIIAHKSNVRSYTYRVDIIDSKVSGLNKKITFKICPKPDKVKLQAKDKTDVWMTYDSVTDIWSGELKRGIEQDVKVIIENKEFGFRTVPSTRMGDDLFDD